MIPIMSNVSAAIQPGSTNFLRIFRKSLDALWKASHAGTRNNSSFVFVKRYPIEHFSKCTVFSHHYFKSAVTVSPQVAYNIRLKHSLVDTSMIPILKEEDIEEWFVKGSGPGGQNVNKRTNCCCLRHIPTGIVVKCHIARELDQNRKSARKMLIERLDDHYNGEMSVRAQLERIALKKSKDNSLKQKRLSDMKKKYKELVSSSSAPDSSTEVPNKNNETPQKGDQILMQDSKPV